MKKKLSTYGVPAVILIVAAVLAWPVIGPCAWSVRRASLERQKLRQVMEADHPALLAACRAMIGQRRKYAGLTGQTGSTIRFSWPLSGDTVTPTIVRDLEPASVEVAEDSVLLILYGGFSHLGVRAYREGHQNGGGNRQLVEGLWLIHDGAAIPGKQRARDD